MLSECFSGLWVLPTALNFIQEFSRFSCAFTDYYLQSSLDANSPVLARFDKFEQLNAYALYENLRFLENFQPWISISKSFTTFRVQIGNGKFQ
jgi:hypothetical protein